MAALRQRRLLMAVHPVGRQRPLAVAQGVAGQRQLIVAATAVAKQPLRGLPIMAVAPVAAAVAMPQQLVPRLLVAVLLPLLVAIVVVAQAPLLVINKNIDGLLAIFGQ